MAVFQRLGSPQKPSVMIFILTILLLAADFYYLKNIAGRRLVGLRWWNEVDTASGNSHWVFESQDRGSTQNLTDKRFFWLALYAQPGLWVGLAIFAIVRFENPIWLSLVGEWLPPPNPLSNRLSPPIMLIRTLIFSLGPSDCSHPNNHKHARLLALRQIQSCIQSRFKRHVFGRCRSESCGWPLQPFVQW